MHKTISQLSQSKKQLEEEKSSLITTIKLIQNDFNQWHYIEKKASDNKIEDSANNIDRVNNSNAWIKPKHQTRQSTELSRDEGKPETSNRFEVFNQNTSSHVVTPVVMKDLEKQFIYQKNAIDCNQRCNPIAIDVEDKPETSNRSNVLNNLKENATDKPTGSPNQSENPPNQCRDPIDVAILGDSMIKFINPSKLRKSLKRNVMVKTFPGANVDDMQHYAKPTVEKNPKSVILHVGTNDLKHSTPKEIAVSISSLGKQIEENSPETKLHSHAVMDEGHTLENSVIIEDYLAYPQSNNNEEEHLTSKTVNLIYSAKEFAWEEPLEELKAFKKLSIVCDDHNRSLVEKLEKLATMITDKLNTNSELRHEGNMAGESKKSRSLLACNADSYSQQTNNVSEYEAEKTSEFCYNSNNSSSCYCKDFTLQIKRIEVEMKLLQNRMDAHEIDDPTVPCNSDLSLRRENVRLQSDLESAKSTINNLMQLSEKSSLTTVIRLLQEDNLQHTNYTVTGTIMQMITKRTFGLQQRHRRKVERDLRMLPKKDCPLHQPMLLQWKPHQQVLLQRKI
ncbi:Scavenger receptor cysteine-rich type 1 M130 [Paramuricea clavata]|uniref:Scavenger receptor cysteine-rich type 1 M130 n=1 Tax=Paramuricea clavata TaxID=317549 RepID=A0A6S7IGB9_PARCT|nr:Scavenger receptor cysteine-rich type 1 M130 [Paramuricea clavata]